MFFAIDTGNDVREQNEDIFVLIFQVYLSSLGNIVFWFSYQRTCDFQNLSKEVELFLFSELHQAVGQHDQDILSELIFNFLVLAVLQCLKDSFQHLHVHDFLLYVWLAAD